METERETGRDKRRAMRWDRKHWGRLCMVLGLLMMAHLLLLFHLVLQRLREEKEQAHQSHPELPSVDRDLRLSTVELLWQLSALDGHCREPLRLGGVDASKGEGAWTVCGVGIPTPCVVYSLGIAGDFSFDDDASARLGCEVHSFDPSMGQGDTRRGERSYFWATGIGDSDSDSRPGVAMGGNRIQRWRVRTLDSLMREHNHTRVDILKMDVEGDEWDSLADWIRRGTLSRVGQLVLEVHLGRPLPSERSRQGEILSTLRSLGFRLHAMRENPMSSAVETGFRNHASCCFELSFMRETGMGAHSTQ